MPLNDNYRNPGAAATNALFEFLAQRETKKRQDFLDEITQSTATRQDEVARGALDVQREQLATVTAIRAA